MELVKASKPKIDGWKIGHHEQDMGSLLKRLMMNKATNRKANGLPGEEEELCEMAARQAI